MPIVILPLEYIPCQRTRAGCGAAGAQQNERENQPWRFVCTAHGCRLLYTMRFCNPREDNRGAVTRAPVRTTELGYAFSNSFSICAISGESSLDLCTAQTMADNANTAMTTAIPYGFSPVPSTPATT